VSAVAADPALAREVRRAARPARRAALLLGLPALLFLLLAFLAPIASLLETAVANPEVRQVLPDTVAALAGWSGRQLPGEPVFAALATDLRRANADRTAAYVGKRLNYELPGMRSTMLSSARMAAAAPGGPWKQRFVAHDEAWGDLATWQVIARDAHPWTAYYLLTAVDLQQSPSGGIARASQDNAIFLGILGRTLWIAALVTFCTLVCGFPVAYLLATAPPRTAQILMLFVLLPLWTSLLVRTTAWVVLLQSDGVINDILMRLGLVAHRLQLIFTRFGTVIAMVHIQLPFTILPIYSVMRGIPAAQTRAARSLGAPPVAAFWRVYAPQTVPGVVAGGLITFILSLGYFITPALLGGPTDQMMSNFISTYINRDLNWGEAAALGTVLLVVTLAIYGLFLRILGPERVRFG
jgi:putative spermidine/putrescine transport system permease protein